MPNRTNDQDDHEIDGTDVPAAGELQKGDALPVFPFSPGQVAEVADALQATGEMDPLSAARHALTALARTMRLESKPDPNGYPSGYGYRQIRGVTNSYVVKPDGSWEAFDA
jgi:hypothetical protein